MRIAIGGFQHETNTFSSTLTRWEDFIDGGDWPSLTSGADIFDTVRGFNIPIAGFIEQAQTHGHTLLPTTWCFAVPAGKVEKEAFERIAGMIVDGVRHSLPVDAVFLELHGAMVTEHLDDGEGELLRRIRNVVGPDVLMVASIDWHANITDLMTQQADGLIGYQTYPHTDKAETGARVFDYLQSIFEGMPRPKYALRRLPFLIPLCWQTSYTEPAAGLQAKRRSLESPLVPSVTFVPGFPAADIPDCSPAVLAYGLTQDAADKAADALFQAVSDAEGAFAGKLYDPDEAVTYALQRGQFPSKPMVIADIQDNAGAGGSADTTGVLRALLRQRAQRAAIGLFADSEAAQAAHIAGVGNKVRIALGGRSGIAGDSPLEAEFIVEALFDGEFEGTGPFRRGFRINLGPSACLRLDDVRIVVTSTRVQLADQSMFRFVGIEPTEQAILVVKSSAHFRADFTEMADEIIMCAAPGLVLHDTTRLPWKRLRKGIRLSPNGPAFG